MGVAPLDLILSIIASGVRKMRWIRKRWSEPFVFVLCDCIVAVSVFIAISWCVCAFKCSIRHSTTSWVPISTPHFVF